MPVSFVFVYARPVSQRYRQRRAWKVSLLPFLFLGFFSDPYSLFEIFIFFIILVYMNNARSSVAEGLGYKCWADPLFKIPATFLYTI